MTVIDSHRHEDEHANGIAHSHELHDHDRDHDHGGHSIIGTIASILHINGHTHDHGDLVGDKALSEDKLGVRTIYQAMALLVLTTLFQIAIYLTSDSVALLGDTVHNFGDAVSSVPLLFAFWLTGRAANKRYTYGYSRSEDLAGVLVVLSIGFSAIYILWESTNRVFNPAPVDNLWWVSAAAIVGFAGNELAGIIQIRAGRKIGSDAMIANGLHARTDGLTSLAVLVAAIGALLGYPIVDAIVGILMSILILFITKDAAKSMWYRLMDAVNPLLIERAENVIRGHPEVKDIQRLQMRWVGHDLHVEAVISINADVNASECYRFSEHLSHHLYHDNPNLTETTIAFVPSNSSSKQFYSETSHHGS